MESLPSWVLSPVFYWFAIGLVLLLAEFAIPGIVIIFFGIGAWLVSLTCAIIDISLTTQLIIFLISSILLLAVFRKRFKSLFTGDSPAFKDMEKALDDFTGKKVLVTRAIEPNAAGKVEFHGSYWDAESDVAIEEGAMVEIVEKNNITFKVKPIDIKYRKKITVIKESNQEG